MAVLFHEHDLVRRRSRDHADAADVFHDLDLPPASASKLVDFVDPEVDHAPLVDALRLVDLHDFSSPTTAATGAGGGTSRAISSTIRANSIATIVAPERPAGRRRHERDRTRDGCQERGVARRAQADERPSAQVVAPKCVDDHERHGTERRDRDAMELRDVNEPRMRPPIRTANMMMAMKTASTTRELTNHNSAVAAG